MKMDGLLDIKCHLESAHVFCVRYISMGIKYLRNFDRLIIILGETILPLPSDHVEKLTVSYIAGRGKFINSLDFIHNLPCLLIGLLENLELPIMIW